MQLVYQDGGLIMKSGVLEVSLAKNWRTCFLNYYASLG